MDITLRTFVFIDSLQPQLASYLATSSQGFLPVPGDACMWIEVAPGMAVHRLSDIALKETNVHLGEQVVERAFGSMEIHYRNQSEVQEAGKKIKIEVDPNNKIRLEVTEKKDGKKKTIDISMIADPNYYRFTAVLIGNDPQNQLSVKSVSSNSATVEDKNDQLESNAYYCVVLEDISSGANGVLIACDPRISNVP